jgi:hypothetical protein
MQSVGSRPRPTSSRRPVKRPGREQRLWDCSLIAFQIEVALHNGRRSPEGANSSR